MAPFLVSSFLLLAVMKNEFALIQVETLQNLFREIEDVKSKIENSTSSIRPVYTEQEVAKMFGVTTRTMANFRIQGKIGFVKPEDSRTILYTKQHIDDFCQKYEYHPFKNS